ncbi:MAG: hypothetical protein HY812_17470 [Planctomycetes bacterium]|nr:hypothetical protein [Planctomycetota bacterium]
MKTKTVVLVVCIVAGAVLLLEQGGVVKFDFHWCWSEFATSHTASTVRVNADANREGLAITMQEPCYSGNLVLPLYKSFTMNYECQVEGRARAGGDDVRGMISGEVKAKIYGLCSRQRAKEMAREEANREIRQYLLEQTKGQ